MWKFIQEKYVNKSFISKDGVNPASLYIKDSPKKDSSIKITNEPQIQKFELKKFYNTTKVCKPLEDDIDKNLNIIQTQTQSIIETDDIAEEKETVLKHNILYQPRIFVLGTNSLIKYRAKRKYIHSSSVASKETTVVNVQ